MSSDPQQPARLPERRPTTEPPRPIQVRPLPAPPPPRRSPLVGLFWILLLGVGAYGGYYGYCRYKVAELERAFSIEMQDLRQLLIRKEGVAAADVTRVVVEAAGRVGVAVKPEEIRVTFEVSTPENIKRLPSVVQTALGMAAQIPGEKVQLYVVGYQARALARYGVAKSWFDSERHTYLEAHWMEHR